MKNKAIVPAISPPPCKHDAQVGWPWFGVSPDILLSGVIRVVLYFKRAIWLYYWNKNVNQYSNGKCH